MILVTGANGFVGSHLMARLVLENGEPVRALARPSADTRSLAALEVEVVRGDITDVDSLRAALRHVNTVIHLVAVPFSRGRQSFEAVNVNGTRNLIRAARENGTRRIVHLGALGASSDPRYPYTYSKWLGEEAVRDSGIAYTVLRPSAQFGEGDGFFSSFAGLISISPFFFPSPGTGSTIFQPIWVEDVVTAIMVSMSDQKTFDQTIEFGGPEHLTYDEMVQSVIKVMGKRRKIIHLPVKMMRLPVLLFSLMPYPPVDSSQLDLLNVRNSAELDACERWFGFKPKRLDEGLDYLKHFDLRKWLRGRLDAP